MIVIIPITSSIIGKSTIRDTLFVMPPIIIVLSVGTAKGLMVIDAPHTKTILKRFAPIILPGDKALWPFDKAVTTVTSSGGDVPIATNVSAITKN